MKLKKKLAAALISSSLMLALSIPVSAHNGWSQTNSPIIAQGEVSYIDQLLGNHSNEHKSYRIAGQWGPDTSKVYITAPSGKKTDITASRFYTGEPATETEPAVNNGFIASFSSSAPGAYIVSIEADSTNAKAATRSLRNGKSFVAVSDVPTVERVKALTGFSRTIAPDRLELVPQFNPAAATPGQEVSVQLLLKGKPLADTEVSVIRRSNSDAQTLKTNADGVISLTTGAADYYLLVASASTEEKQEGAYNSTKYEATMTFTVQNGSANLPASGSASAVPYLYVNGKPVAGEQAVIENGVTHVSADFVRQHINAGYSGQGVVALRKAAEEAGAVIEFLPAVGDNRSSVLVYTQK